MSAENNKKELLQQLPDKPGIYKFFNLEKELIYVGKAKNIKKRVSNYFNKLTLLDNKTKKLVSQIDSIEFTIVDSEFDAYLLENNLIKSHQPKYNILLKDDKTYPYLYISDERFPQVISTRKYDKSLGTYYGPYTSVKAMNTVLELIRKLYTVRTCNFNLSQKNIDLKKFKICLEYHIGNCKGPCEGLINEEEYNENIRQIHHILKGNIQLAKTYFKEEMQKASANLEFEKAQKLKNKLDLLEKFQSGSIIVSTTITDLDVYTIISEENAGVINYLKIINGTIQQTKTLEVKKKLNESDEEILTLAIINIREELGSNSKEIITNIPLSVQLKDANLFVPQKGEKKKLIDLSVKNNIFRLNKIREEARPGENRVLITLQKDLQLKTLPFHIECFDNSNIQGTNPVAAMVCFKNGKPSKKDYRHYNIKTVIGPNDFDSMYEIVHRRYRRLLEENTKLPDLIIVDGGKGQLSAACRALTDLNIYGQIPIIGVAKKLEEIFYPGDSEPLYISKKSESLLLIQRIRDEAHRFGITHHRNKRSKSSLNSELSELDGIGEKTYQKLIQKFRTLTNIKAASIEELAEVIGQKKAEELKSKLS